MVLPMNPVSQAGQNVTRRLQRGPDGVVRLLFVDPKTGQSFINPPPGYGVIEPEDQYLNLEELGLSPTKPDKTKGEPNKTVAETVKESVGNDNASGTGGVGGGRSATNNFGYINEPGVLGFTNMAPGMIGMASRGINAGINANNVEAANASRGLLGLDPMGPMGTVSGVIGLDKGLEQGHVANVSIGPNTYSIGLEAMDDQGRTTMTPNDARSRALSLGLPINEVDDEAMGPAPEDGKGFLSGVADFGKGLVDEASSFFSGLFGPDDPSVGMGAGGFPDAPSPTGQENGYGVDMAGNTGTGPAGPSFGGGDTNSDTGSGQGYSGMGGQDSPGEGAGGGPGGPSGAQGAGEADSDSDSDN